MFLGQFQHTLDPKGRLIVPSQFRAELEEGLVMTVGPDNCLTVHPYEDWQRVVEDVRKLRTTDSGERRFARMLTSSAHPGELDRQGRMTIPPFLRDYAGLEKDVVVVGADARFELWDAERWETYRAQGLDDFANTNRAFDLGGL